MPPSLASDYHFIILLFFCATHLLFIACTIVHKPHALGTLSSRASAASFGRPALLSPPLSSTTHNLTLSIAAFLPQSNKQYLNFKYTVQSALEIIADKYSPHNGISLELYREWNDEVLTQGNETVLSEIQSDLEKKENLIAGIGAYASHSTLALSSLFQKLNKTVLSFASTAQALSANPHIMRMVASDHAEINAIMDFVFVTEWDDVFVLYSDTVYGHSGLGTARKEAGERGIRIAGYETVRHPVDDFDVLFQKVKASNAKTVINIISFSSFEFDMKDFLRNAEKHGLLSPGINWFFTQTMEHVIKTEFHLDAALRELCFGFFMISQQNNRWSFKSDFYKQLNMHLRGPNVPVDKDFVEMLSLYDSYLFDCVMTVYQTAVHMIQIGEDPTNGVDFQKRMREYHSIGASGTISFDQNGDRLGLITRIVNVGYDGAIHEVASYSIQEGIHNLRHYNAQNHSVSVFSPGLPNLYWKHILKGTPNVDQVKYVSIPLFGNSPSSRYGHCAGVVENEMVIFGGRNTLSEGGLTSEYLNDIYVYAFDTALWRYLAPLSKYVPDGRESSQCSMHGRSLYILHGKDQYYILDNFNKFDLDEQTFQSISVFTPRPRYNGGMIRRGDELYAFGGATSSGFTNDVWKYDVLTRSDWKAITPVGRVMPRKTEKFAMEYSEYHDAFFVFGGRYNGHESTNDMWKFSFGTNEWTEIVTIGDKPGKRYACGMVTFDHRVFVGLGWLLNPITIPEVDDIWEIDLGNDTQTTTPQWKLLTTTPQMEKRDSIPMLRWHDQLIIFGGIYIDKRYNDFYSHDILLQQTRKVHENYFSPPPVTSSHAVQIGSKMLLWGGVSFQGQLLSSQLAYVLDLDTLLWAQATTMTDPPPARHSHTAVGVGDRVFVYGGKDTKDLIFHDLWIMNYLPSNNIVWSEVELQSPAPSPRAEHSSFYDGRNLYVTHGAFHQPVSDSWSWDTENERWSKQVLKGNAANVALAHCRSQFMPKFNTAYYIGCTNADGASSVTLYRYKVDSGEFELFMYQQLYHQYFVWSRPLVVPVRDDSIIIFGGNDEDLVTNQLIMVNVDKQQIIVAHPDPYLMPDARTLATGTYYNNKLVIFGGTAALPGANKLVKSIIVGDTWSINLTPVMSESLNHTLVDPSAVQCSHGTFEYRGICLPCDLGSFKNTIEYKGTCSECLPGEYSSVLAANSRLLCLPCAAGTYSSTGGAKECAPCPPGKFCPIASSIPLDEPPFTDPTTKAIVIQPNPVLLDVSVNKIVLFALMSVASVATIIMTMALVCMWKIGILKLRNLLFFDKFFTTSHHSWYGLMRKKQTVVGAVFSISAFLLVLMYFFSFSFDFLNGGNEEEFRSLSPNLAQSNNTITVPKLSIDLVAHTYRGRCVKDQSSAPNEYTKCVDEIIVESTGFTHAGENPPHFSCKYIPALTNNQVPQCHIQWLCENCRKSFRSEILFVVDEDESYASTLSYGVKASSGYREYYSTVNQSIHGDVDSFFRGKQATLVVLSAISTIYNESLTALRPLHSSVRNLEGYHLDFQSLIQGSQVDHQTFHHATGFKARFILEETPYILVIEKRNKRELVRFITETLAACVGIIGAIRVVMIVCERIVDRLKIKNALSVAEQDAIDEELEFLNLIRGCFNMIRNRKKRKKRVIELQEKLLKDSEFFMLEDLDPEEAAMMRNGTDDDDSGSTVSDTSEAVMKRISLAD